MKTKNNKAGVGGRSRKKQAVLSVLLIAAIIITGAFAFLSATDSKINVFTVGSVKIDLTEEFDTNLNGTIEEDEKFDASAKTVSIDNGKTILPAQKIIKRPSITNTGKNNAYVYMAVGLPVAEMSDVYSTDANGSVDIADKKVDIKLRAYAIQENYRQADDADEAWKSYFDSASLGTEASQSDPAFAERVQLFKTYSDTNSDNAVNNEWTQIGTYYTELEAAEEGSGFANLGYNWHIYKYDTTLEAGETTESALFDKVALVKDIGDGMPISVSYYAPESVISTASLSTMSVEESNIPADYVLVNKEYYTSGDVVSKLYTPDYLAKTGYRYDWVFADDVKTAAYSGMTVLDDTELVVTYEDLVGTNGSYDGSPYLVYILDTMWTPNGEVTCATLIGADSSNANYPTSPTTVIVPDTVTIVGDSSVSNSYAGKAKSLRDGAIIWDATHLANGTTLPVKKIWLAQSHYSYRIAGVDGNTGFKGQVTPQAAALTNIAETITIPDSVEWFDFRNGEGSYENGSYVASNNSALKKINIPASCSTCINQHALQWHTNLEDVVLPNTLTGIPMGMFQGCISLKTITIPDSVTAVDLDAFNLSGVEEITIGIGVNAVCCVGSVSDFKTVNIKDLARFCSIEFDGANCGVFNYDKTTSLLLNGTKITDLVIPSSVTEIKDVAFAYCADIQSVTIPNTVKSIGLNAFAGLDITTIDIPDSVKDIDSGAFGACKKLNKIKMSSNLTHLGSRAFDGTEYATNYAYGTNFEDGLLYIDNYLICCDGFSETYNIKFGITLMADFAFGYNEGLQEIVIPGSISKVSECAFCFCTNLKKVTISEGVKCIGHGAFDCAENLTTVSIPKSVTKIEDNIFNGISNVENINVIYAGTTTEWSAISLGQHNTGITVQCTDGTVTT